MEGEFFDDDEVDDHQDMRLDIEDMSYEVSPPLLSTTWLNLSPYIDI